jgi:uncharacterized delta-60 repeat protein
MRPKVKFAAVLLAMFAAVASRADDDQGRKTPPSEKANDVVTAQAVDAQGDVYLTGYSKAGSSGYDYLTLKYASDGKLLWARRYDGPGHGDDKPRDIGIDASGNVYVTGCSQSDTSDADYLTLKYSSDGHLDWANRYNGAGNGYDQACSIAVNRDGRCSITGFSLGQGTGYDCVTVSYSSDGKELWHSVYNGPANEDDFGTSVKLDREGNTYVAGYSRTGRRKSNYIVVKYDGAGRQAWAQTYGLRGDGDSRAAGLTITPSGSICVSGYSPGAHGLGDIVTVAYNDAGKMLWNHRYDGSAHGDDRPSAVSSTPHSNLVVVGASEGDSGSGKDFVTFVLSPQGKQLWAARANGPGDGDDVPAALAVDSADNIVVTGYSLGVGTGSDMLTIKYRSDGTELWSQRYNGVANDVDRAAAVGTDSDGNVYISGSSWGGKDSGFDFVTVKYSADGQLLWTRRYDGKGQ